MPQVPNASTSLPHEDVFALDKVVKQICVSLFTTQPTIEGVPMMLCLEALSNFAAISWGIQVHGRNKSKNLDKEQVKNQEKIIKTSKIECHPKDVKANLDMVYVDTSK